MAQIAQAFATARTENRLALIGYLPAGYPSPDAFLQLSQTAFAAGLDILEIGLPTENAFLDGKAIRQALVSAHAQGVTMEAALALSAEALARKDSVGLFMLYEDLLQHYGQDRLLSQCGSLGLSGILPVGMPYLNWRSFAECARQYQVAAIGFITPEMDAATMRQTAQLASGFFYVQSRSGTTGQQGEFGSAVGARLDEVKTAVSESTLPLALGFGIRSAADVAEIRRLDVDGVIAGTALVEAAAQGALAVQDLIGGMAEAAQLEGG